MKVMFATAELAPAVRVGGLAEASTGLIRALSAAGVEVDVVLPDYFGLPLAGERTTDLPGPPWADRLHARQGTLEGFGPVTLVGGAGIARPHPYVDEHGAGWPDNDRRFAAFSAAVGMLAGERRPDVVHLNDWHTAMAHAWLPDDLPTVLTIHTLAHQGWADPAWLGLLPAHAEAYERWGSANALLGSIRLAGAVVAVSPTYAAEIVRPEHGFGLHDELAARDGDLVGILNGLDLEEWHPATDRHIAARYDVHDLSGKPVCREALLDELDWPDDGEPLIGMVSRLVHQKGIDLALDAVRYLEGIGARVVLLGSGEQHLVDAAREVAWLHPDRFAFREGYDDALGHRIVAGADLLLMPSRFEPCGLAQMQAMVYGTIPVVTGVGGLLDTVTDDDAARRASNGRHGGTGFVSGHVEPAGVVDALHRAVRAWRNPRRRSGIVARGMSADWSWGRSAAAYMAVYERLVPPPGGGAVEAGPT